MTRLYLSSMLFIFALSLAVGSVPIVFAYFSEFYSEATRTYYLVLLAVLDRRHGVHIVRGIGHGDILPRYFAS